MGWQPGIGTLKEKMPEAPFDERGGVYLHNGPPDRIIRTLDMKFATEACSTGMGPAVYNESWLYHCLEERPRLINFVRCNGLLGYVVPYTTPCGASGDARYQTDRQFIDDALCSWRTPERTLEFAREHMAVDTDAPDFSAATPFAWDMFAFRGSTGQRDLSVPVGVAGDSLHEDVLADGRRGHRLRLSLFVVDTAAQRVSHADTVESFVGRSARRAGDRVREPVRTADG